MNWFSLSTSTTPACLILVWACLMGMTVSDETIRIASFSKETAGEALPMEWQRLALSKKKETDYTLVEDSGKVVIRALSDNAASGLIKRVDIDPDTYQYLTWHWKVSNILQNGDVMSKRGDDFPARIYITFDYNPKNLRFGERLKYRALRALGYRDIPLRAINYVWSNKAPQGTMVRNAYTDWVSMIAVKSGEEQINTWHVETRNLYEDYIAAFGEIPGRINGIALMTDTDNTGEQVMAYFGDITLQKP